MRWLCRRARHLPWSSACTRRLRHPDVVQKLRALHVQAQDSTPAQTAQLLQSEIQRWGVVIEKAHIPKQ